MSALAQRFGNAPAFDGTVDGLKRKLAGTGLCGALNLPVATKPEQVDSINAWMPEEQLVRMVRAHDSARVVFGRDGPWQDCGTVLEAFLRLPFTAAEQRQILLGNASRLLGMQVLQCRR